MPKGPSPSRDVAIAWTADVLVATYFLWIALHLWRITGAFAQMFEALGGQLPPSTAFLIRNGGWLYPLLFGGLALLVFGKEFVVRDKRLSTMITFLLAVVGQFVGHWMTTVYYLPLFDLIRGLS